MRMIGHQELRFRRSDRGGEVQLSGYVDALAQINRAIGIGRGVEGVQSIGNEMGIKKR